MVESWLDDSDLPMPILTRSSSQSSVDADSQESRINSLVQNTLQLSICDGIDDDMNQACNSNFFSQNSGAFFVDEPECYDGLKSPVLFDEPEAIFVSSPQTAGFPPSPADSLPSDGNILDIEVPNGILADSLIPSPASAEFSSQDIAMNMRESHMALQRSDGEGRRKALLIGIKYYRNPNHKSLKGPHHDVREVQGLLQDVYGWSRDCFRILKDDNSGDRNQPTLENIRREMKQLVRDAQPRDHLFFYYSGHGGQVVDLDEDEEDGMDEVIVSCDGKMLVDDELYKILVEPLPHDCHLTALLDCCSSGTSLDLPYNALKSRKPTRQSRPVRRKHSKGNVVLLSACADAERAYEKQDYGDEDKRVRGMLTKAFIESLRTRRKSTYDELLSSVRSHLRRKDTMQDPQLSSSRVIDMNEYFDL